MDQQAEARIVETIRLMRNAQKRYFATRTQDALSSMRAAEKLVKEALPDDKPIRSYSPDGYHLFHLTQSMIRFQESWVQTRRRISDLESAGQDATKARDEAARLQSTCEKKERDLDRCILAYTSPKLPGLA